MQRSRHAEKMPVHHVGESRDESSDEDCTFYVIMSSSKSKPYQVDITISSKSIKVEVNSGASLTLVLVCMFTEHWPELQLTPTRTTLRSYRGECILVLENVDVVVNYGHKTATLPLLVIKGDWLSLLGRNWLKLDWHYIFWLHNTSLGAVLDEHKAVFEPGLGKVTDYHAKILLDPSATPKYCKARPIPYFYHDKVEKELHRLVQEGMLEPVEHSEWASPIVAVLKPDKQSVRIYSDFKQTVNPVSKLDRYPILEVEDLFAKLSKSKRYTRWGDQEASNCEHSKEPLSVY